MENGYDIFKNYSLLAEIGVVVPDISGEIKFKSSVYKNTENFLNKLYTILDCDEACRVAMLYACYQARRFGGRYIFSSPSGLFYCASPLTDKHGQMTSGVVAGPFLMSDYDEYIEIDVYSKRKVSKNDVEILKEGLNEVPIKTPAQALAAVEQLYVCTSYFSNLKTTTYEPVLQMNAFAAAYPIEKEEELLAAISKGDIETANSVLNYILGLILFHFGNNLEILRSRVAELTVLLSRAALRGGADIEAIFGLNYGYLREIDALSSVDDIIMWLHMVTKRFSQHVFDYADAKHVDIIYKAIGYIKKNYRGKITLQDISDHVFLSPAYFCKIFKDETGQTPGGYITGIRIEESKRLLRDLSVNIANIPELVGFENQSYFTRVFKKSESCTPGEYRRRYGRMGV